jgi:hypothetical protein
MTEKKSFDGIEAHPLLVTDRTEKLEKIVNPDAKNRASVIRDIREMIKTEATKYPVFRDTIAVPHTASNTDILIFTPG